jgi:uncharacterized membrane protein (DUF485 family)
MMTLFLLILLIDVSISYLIAKFIGESKEIGFGWSFIVCLFLTPLVGFIITMMNRPKNNFDRY